MSTRDPFNDYDIVKRGYVHIKRPPSNVKLRLKAWQKRYFVLVDATVENGGRTQLEIHDSEGDWRESRRRQSLTYAVDLRSVTTVEEYRESRRFANAFIVARSGQCPLVLGANTDLEMKEWVAAIKMLAEKTRPALATRGSIDGRSMNGVSGSPYLARCGRLVTPSPDPQRRMQVAGPTTRCHLPPPVYARRESRGSQGGYSVLVEPTEASARNGLSGEYVMNVRGGDVILRKVGQQMAYIQWPLAHIRKFKSEEMTGDDLVTLDANAQCGSKVGTYLFRTRNGNEIVKEVSDAVKTNLPRQNTGADFESEMERLRINKEVDPYLDLIPVDSDTSDETDTTRSTLPPNESPPPLAQRQRQHRTQQAQPQQQLPDPTQQPQQPEATQESQQTHQHRDSENSSADSAIFISECSSDHASQSGVEYGRREATPASEDIDESDDGFPLLSPPPPPPPRQRNPLLHHSLPLSSRPVPPPLPARTSV